MGCPELESRRSGYNNRFQIQDYALKRGRVRKFTGGRPIFVPGKGRELSASQFDPFSAGFSRDQTGRLSVFNLLTQC